MIELMVTGCIDNLMELFMRVSGEMIFNTDLERNDVNNKFLYIRA